MIPLNISIDSAVGVTNISNNFIDNYMKDANDAQLKIYLYLLRMTSSNLPTDITEIADKFNLTEKDLYRALKYWEKNGLLSIIYDDNNKNISGIRIHDLNVREKSDNSCACNITNKSVTTTTPNVANNNIIINTTIDNMDSSEAAVHESVSNKMDYATEKNNYSLDQLKALKKDPDFAMLINIASQYLSHPLSPVEIRTLAFIYDKLGFSMDLADHLIEFVVDNGNKSIHYIEQTAIDWFENNITTVNDAKKHAKKFNKHAYQIMSFLGKSGTITNKELAYINRWTNEYKFTLDIIEEACSRSVMRVEKNRFAYAESILKDWYDNNVHSISDIAVLDNNFQASKSAPATPSYTRTVEAGNSSNNKIEQRDYDFDELERLLISNQ